MQDPGHILGLGEQNQEKAVDGPAKGQEEAQDCLGIKGRLRAWLWLRGKRRVMGGSLSKFSICKMGTVTKDACLRDDEVYLTILLCH